MAKPTTAVGTYTGTGAAINISIGFVPAWVEVINKTDGDKRFVFSDGATFVHTGGTNATATVSSNGISAFAGTRGGVGAGFTAGTELSTNAKVYVYIAHRGA
jgi:hypothetical protein